MITGGAAGDNHNNMVTSNVDQTFQAMAIANRMSQQKMTKVVNHLNKDFRALNQRPAMGFYNGVRYQYTDVVEKDEKGRKVKDGGARRIK